jgi:hypothetical protein
MSTTTYLPIAERFATRTTSESPREFGLRAFRFLMGDRLSVLALDDATLDLALAASQEVVIASEMADSAREVMRSLRFDILSTLERRRRDERAAAAKAPVASAAPAPRPKSGGLKTGLRRPVPVVPPGGASARPF